ncbi:hypothetical protein [Actinomycetospora sp. CA-053990]|uniref:hypothetical protein n=1 Tax=Actinomycetospora sp. CA-053990 TaxID=3239891 RepID=UPI003D8B1ADB
MTQTAAAHSTTTSRATGVLRAFQVLAVLTVVELQGRELHETGAVALHVLSGLTTVAAIALWRLRRAPVWPAALSAVVFVLTFVQAYLGDDETLYLHVPGALILSVGSVWLAVWGLVVRAGSRR